MQPRKIFGNINTKVVNFALNEISSRMLIQTSTNLIIFDLTSGEILKSNNINAFFEFFTFAKQKPNPQIDKMEALHRLSLWMLLFDSNKVLLFNNKFSRSNVFMVEYIVNNALFNSNLFELILDKENKQIKFFKVCLHKIESNIKPTPTFAIGQSTQEMNEQRWFDHVGFKLKLKYLSLRDIFLPKKFFEVRIDDSLGLLYFLLVTGDLLIYDAFTSQLYFQIEKLDLLTFDFFQENLFVISKNKLIIFNLFSRTKKRELILKKRETLRKGKWDIRMVVLVSSMSPFIYLIDKSLNVVRVDLEEHTATLELLQKHFNKCRMSHLQLHKNVLKEYSRNGTLDQLPMQSDPNSFFKFYLYYKEGNLTLVTSHLNFVQEIILRQVHKMYHPLSDFKRVSNSVVTPTTEFGMISMTYEVEVLELKQNRIVHSYKLNEFKSFSPSQIIFIDYNNYGDAFLIQKNQSPQIFKLALKYSIIQKDLLFCGAPDFIRYNHSDKQNADYKIQLENLAHVQSKYSLAIVQNTYMYIMFADFVSHEIRHLKTLTRSSRIIQLQFTTDFLVSGEKDGKIVLLDLVTFEPIFMVHSSYTQVTTLLIENSRSFVAGTRYGDIELISVNEKWQTSKNTLKYHLDKIVSLELASDVSGEYLFSLSLEKTLVVWSMNSRTVQLVFMLDNGIKSILFVDLIDLRLLSGDIYLFSLKGIAKIPLKWSTVPFNFLKNTEFLNYRNQMYKELKKQSFEILSSQKEITKYRNYFSFNCNLHFYNFAAQNEKNRDKGFLFSFFQIWNFDFNFANVRKDYLVDEFALFFGWIKRTYPSNCIRDNTNDLFCMNPFLAKLTDKVHEKFRFYQSKENESLKKITEYEKMISKPFQNTRPKSVYESLIKNTLFK